MAGYYRLDTEDLGRGSPRGHYYGRQPLLEIGQLAVQATEVASWDSHSPARP